MPQPTTLGPLGSTVPITIQHLGNLRGQVNLDNGYPTFDSNFNLIYTVNTNEAQWFDNTDPVSQLLYDLSYQCLAYICDVWTETANRFAPGKNGEQGDMVGIKVNALGTNA